MSYRETNQRSITKSVTFRLAVIFADVVVIYVLTRRVVDTIAITALTNVASTVLYYLHERVWNGIAWGKRGSRR